MKTATQKPAPLKGPKSALSSIAATVPLAPFLVLLILVFIDRSDFNMLAEGGCIVLGWIIALPVALFLSFVVLTPLAYATKKFLAGPKFKWVLGTTLAFIVTAFLGFLITLALTPGTPNIESFGLAIWGSGLICILIGTAVFALQFRRELLKEAQLNLFEPKLPPIPARMEGLNRHCRIGKRRVPVGYSYPSFSTTDNTLKQTINL